MFIIWFWIVWGLLSGLLVAMPTQHINTTCITLQSGLLLNVLAGLVGMTGQNFAGVVLVILGLLVVVYALVNCVDCYPSHKNTQG